jgi:hypothetical protein
MEHPADRALWLTSASRETNNCTKITKLQSEKAKILAIGVSVDKPAVDPTRRISILNADRVEISTVPIYSKPA